MKSPGFSPHILVFCLCILFLLLLSGPAVNSGDSAVYLHQARSGEVGIRTLHVGYLAPLAGLVAFLPASWHEGVASLVSVICAGLSLLAVYLLSGDEGEKADICPRLLAPLTLLAWPPFLGQLGLVEVYLPQLCLLLWGVWCWREGLLWGAGLLFGWALLVSPTSLLFFPLLWAWPRSLVFAARVSGVALLLYVAVVWPHVSDYLEGPRGLFQVPAGDLDQTGAILRLWRSVVVGWPAGVVLWWGGKGKKPWFLMGMGLVVVAATWRHSDVPLMLPWGALVVVWAARGGSALSPRYWWLGIGLVLQLLVSSKQWQVYREEREGWRELCEVAHLELGQTDRVVGRWGEIRHLGWCLSEDPYDPRGVVWPGEGGEVQGGRRLMWPPGTSVRAFTASLRRR